MSDLLYTDLTVSVRQRADTGNYDFGVWLDGAFVVLASRKPGGIQDDIARAKDAVAQAATAAAAAAPPVAGTTDKPQDTTEPVPAQG